jgi:hypothetical protein
MSNIQSQVENKENTYKLTLKKFSWMILSHKLASRNQMEIVADFKKASVFIQELL